MAQENRREPQCLKPPGSIIPAHAGRIFKVNAFCVPCPLIATPVMVQGSDYVTISAQLPAIKDSTTMSCSHSIPNMFFSNLDELENRS